MPALAGDNSRMRKAESATIKSDALTVSRTTTALRLARTPQSARLPSSGTLHASFPRAGDHQQASQQLRQPEPPVLAGPVVPRRCWCSIYTPLNRFLLKPPIQPEDVHTLIYHRRLFVGRHVVVLRWYILRDGWTKGSSASCGRNIRTLSSSYSRSTRFFSSSLAANAARNAASADAAAPTATTMESPFPPPSPVCCIGVRAAETKGLKRSATS